MLSWKWISFYQRLLQYAAFVIANLGGGCYGHLALYLDAAHCNNRARATFIAPYNPGEYSPSTWAHYSGNEQQQQLDDWKKEYSTIHTCHNIHKALKSS